MIMNVELSFRRVDHDSRLFRSHFVFWKRDLCKYKIFFMGSSLCFNRVCISYGYFTSYFGESLSAILFPAYEYLRTHCTRRHLDVYMIHFSFASFKKLTTIIIITIPIGNAAIMLTD